MNNIPKKFLIIFLCVFILSINLSSLTINALSLTTQTSYITLSLESYFDHDDNIIYIPYSDFDVLKNYDPNITIQSSKFKANRETIIVGNDTLGLFVEITSSDWPSSSGTIIYDNKYIINISKIPLTEAANIIAFSNLLERDPEQLSKSFKKNHLDHLTTSQIGLLDVLMDPFYLESVLGYWISLSSEYSKIHSCVSIYDSSKTIDMSTVNKSELISILNNSKNITSKYYSLTNTFLKSCTDKLLKFQSDSIESYNRTLSIYDKPQLLKLSDEVKNIKYTITLLSTRFKADFSSEINQLNDYQNTIVELINKIDNLSNKKITSFIPDKSITIVNETVTFTAKAEPVLDAIYEFYIYENNQWVRKQKFSSDNTFTYSNSKPGIYQARVFVKEKGAISSTDCKTIIFNITTTNNTTSTITSIDANNTIGTIGIPTTFIANSTFPEDTLYEFYVNESGTWVRLQAFSPKSTVSYTPKNIGSLKLRVFAKNLNSPNKSDHYQDFDYTVKSLPILTSLTFTSNSTDGSEKITFTATSDYTNAVLYEFYIYQNNQWSRVQRFSSSNSFTFSPQKSENYLIRVFVKHNLSDKASDQKTLSFSLK